MSAAGWAQVRHVPSEEGDLRDDEAAGVDLHSLELLLAYFLLLLLDRGCGSLLLAGLRSSLLQEGCRYRILLERLRGLTAQSAAGGCARSPARCSRPTACSMRRC